MIEGETAFVVWKKVLEHVQKNCHSYKDSRGRNCLEVQNIKVTINNPREGVTAPIESLQGIPEWCYPSLQEIAEAMVNRTTQEELGGQLVYSYASRLFNDGVTNNQIDDFIIPLLKKDPSSRRAYTSLFMVGLDTKIDAQHVPGMVGMHFTVREGKLNVVGMLRSNDLFIGWPANIYHLFVILEYVSARLGVDIGTITTFSTSAHIFEEHLKYIRELM